MGHGGDSRSDDEAGRAKLEDEVGGREETKRWVESEISGRRTKGREGGEKIGGLSFGSWAHRPLESEIASDRN